ncbi:hypothetical protein PG984_016396 [Apiospora sp. TS-2023a]
MFCMVGLFNNKLFLLLAGEIRQSFQGLDELHRADKVPLSQYDASPTMSASPCLPVTDESKAGLDDDSRSGDCCLERQNGWIDNWYEAAVLSIW